MSIANIIDSLKKTEGSSVFRAVEQRLFDRNVTVTEVDPWVHPSGMGDPDDLCLRELFFERFTPVEKYPPKLLRRDFKPGTYRIFDNGEHSHIRWQSYLIEAGICDPRKGIGWEVPIESTELGIRGHADAIVYPDAVNTVQLIRLPSGHGGSVPQIDEKGFKYKILSNKGVWKPAGSPVVFDLKTMDDTMFQWLTEPLLKHLVQITCYAGVLGIPDWVFFYESKNTQKVKAYERVIDQKMWAKIRVIMLEVERAKRKQVLPKRELCRSKMVGLAAKCPWADICFETRDYKQLVNIDGVQKNPNPRKILKTTRPRKERAFPFPLDI